MKLKQGRFFLSLFMMFLTVLDCGVLLAAESDDLALNKITLTVDVGLQRGVLADIDECGYDQLHMSLSDPLNNCPLLQQSCPKLMYLIQLT